MSCGVGCRQGLNLALLWLWRRPAAIAMIQPLAWERTYAMDVALKRQRDKKKKKKKERKQNQTQRQEAGVRLSLGYLSHQEEADFCCFL